jgi:hypothetical protein
MPFNNGEIQAGNGYQVLQSPLSISKITNSNPGRMVVVGSANAGWQSGDRIYVPNAGGMRQLNGAYITITDFQTKGNSADQFTISNVVTVGGAPTVATLVSSDTTYYAAHSRGGTAQRQVPDINAALMAAADEYATGDPARQDKALQWVYNDLLNGCRLNSSAACVSPKYSTIADLKALYAEWESATKVFGKRTVLYEGAYDAVWWSSTSAQALGVDPVGCVGSSCYGGFDGKVNALRMGFKYSHYLYDAQAQLFTILKNSSNGVVPAYSVDIDNRQNVGSIWALVFGNINSKPFSVFHQFVNSNALSAPK